MTKSLYIKTSEDVMHSSPWIIAEGLKPHRIVIRDLGPVSSLSLHSSAKVSDDPHEYVVHDEVLTGSNDFPIVPTSVMKTSFMTGYYTTSIEDAIEVFADRAKRSIRRGTIAEEVTYV